MIRFFFAVLTVLISIQVSAEETQEYGLEPPGYHAQPEWFKTSFLDLREDVAEAAANGKRVMLYFYQDGCPYCAKLLETNFSQHDIVAYTRQHFDVIALNIWGDREVTENNGQVLSEKQLAEQFKVMYTPTLIFLNEKGKQVLRLNGYYPPGNFLLALKYVGGKHEHEKSIREFAAGMETKKSSGKLHTGISSIQPPYDLSALSGKPLMVLFEQKTCPACDELHNDILKRPESREQWQRYDRLVLDMWSDEPLVTPAGKQTTARDWAKALGIQYAPSIVFFDKGKEIFRTEAYLRAFHTQSAMDYVASGAYRTEPNFQRYISARAEHLEEQGTHVDIMK